MKYKVGDRVAFSFQRHAIHIGASIPFVGDILFKGRIIKIKTHYLFLFKRDYPIYKVCGIWVNERTLKPIITCK